MDKKEEETALIRVCIICGTVFTFLCKIPEKPELFMVECPTCSYVLKATVLPSGIINVEETWKGVESANKRKGS